MKQSELKGQFIDSTLKVLNGISSAKGIQKHEKEIQ